MHDANLYGEHVTGAKTARLGEHPSGTESCPTGLRDAALLGVNVVTSQQSLGGTQSARLSLCGRE